jgi:hypothetical protein
MPALSSAWAATGRMAAPHSMAARERREKYMEKSSNEECRVHQERGR